MFYKKRDVKPETESIVVKIDDFSKGLNLEKEQNALDPNFCVSVYNFACNKGVLTESFGIKNLQSPNYQNKKLFDMEQEDGIDWVNLKNVWFFKMYDKNNGGRVDKLLFYASDKLIYYSRIITQVPCITSYYDDIINEVPTFNYNIKYDGVDYNLFGNETDGIYKIDGLTKAVKLTNFPKLNSMCEDKGKLFGSGYGERNVVFYHNNLNFNEWTETSDENNGKIQMNDDRGKINKVIPFLGYVFAIRDYGISKIINYENKNTLDVVHLNLSGSRIFENTVQICGDKMLMLTKDGLCSFNGVANKILNLSFNEMLEGIDNDCAQAVFHSGKYYLACRLNFLDDNVVGCESLSDFKNNALIVLDVETMKFEILRGIDIKSMCSIKLNSMDKIAIILNNMETQRVFELDRTGKFYDFNLKKVWISPLTDLGYSNKIKFVREISVLSKYDASITIFTEKSKKTFKICGKDTLNKIKVNLKGKQIGVKIESCVNKAYIANLKINVDLLDYGFKK